MAISSDIAIALERNRRAFVHKPNAARQSTHTRATSEIGFLTTCREGGSVLACDMPAIMGGTGQAPTPGVFGRACLSACIVMGLRIAAERNGVPVAEIAVDLSMDWDNRGMFGMDGVSAGPENIQLKITLTSTATKAELGEVVAEGIRNDPWLIALRDAHSVQVDLQIAQEG